MSSCENTKVLAFLTCFNRKEKTKNSISTLTDGNKNLSFTFVVVDDGSTDGTEEEINELKKTIDIIYIRGDGNLYYTGGMHMAMKYAKDNGLDDYDYYLLMNDDVMFFPECIETLIRQSKELNDSVIVGATRDDSGKTSYGAIVYTRNVQHRTLDISEWEKEADTFNGNCVLVPKELFMKTEIMDGHYTHAIGDFDYGLDIKRNGGKIYSSREYIGVCNRNNMKGHWSDKTLPRLERLKRKETPKGLPRKEWFYYLKKNHGIWYSIFYSLVPYVNIILGR